MKSQTPKRVLIEIQVPQMLNLLAFHFSLGSKQKYLDEATYFIYSKQSNNN